MRLMTIGFTQSTAEHFFGRLRAAGVKRVVDTRLNGSSQLAGFAKQRDLGFFARALAGADYLPLPDLAPTQELLSAYRDGELDWSGYEKEFLALMAQRRIESTLDRASMDGACLLCSEAAPHHCHRRLVAEYLRGHWDGVEIEHL